jgi:hypothetical protein
MMIEAPYPEFKKIPNWDYKISKDGRVYSMKSKSLISVNDRGTFNMYQDGKRTNASSKALIRKLFKKELATETLAKLKKLGIKVRLKN